MIQSDKITVIDNVFSTKISDNIESVLCSPWFPWYLNNGIDQDNDGRFQFVHNFYKENEWRSYEKEVLNPILEKLNPLSLIKIKANLTMKELDNFEPVYHIDVDNIDSQTAIYYVNNNNGKTLFKNNEIIDCKKNRLVIFPSSIFHTGIMHSNNVFGGKCVINFNFIPILK
jgi:hypothetical protein